MFTDEDVFNFHEHMRFSVVLVSIVKRLVMDTMITLNKRHSMVTLIVFNIVCLFITIIQLTSLNFTIHVHLFKTFDEYSYENG